MDKENLYIEPTTIDTRKRSRKNRMMSLSEKVQIIHQAVVMKLPHKDIAKEHRISTPYVSILQKRALKNKSFIAEL